MAYDLADCARINFTAQFDPAGGIAGLDCTWVGDSNLVACSFDLLEESDPHYLQAPPLDALLVGDTVRIGEFTLKVVEINQSLECVFLERQEVSNG